MIAFDYRDVFFKFPNEFSAFQNDKLTKMTPVTI